MIEKILQLKVYQQAEDVLELQNTCCLTLNTLFLAYFLFFCSPSHTLELTQVKIQVGFVASFYLIVYSDNILSLNTNSNKDTYFN